MKAPPEAQPSLFDERTKRCVKCGEEKVLSDYYLKADGKGGKRPANPRCKACVLAGNSAARDAKHPDGAARKRPFRGTVPQDMKRCCRCETIKSPSDFARCQSKPDGLQIICRACTSERNRLRTAPDILNFGSPVKICLRCVAERPIAEFHRTKANNSGLEAWCKKCSSHVAAERRAANPEHARALSRASYWRNYQETRRRKTEYSREWRNANRERWRGYLRAVYWADPEKGRAKRRRLRNPERERAYRRAYWQKNKARLREYARAYYLAHADHYRQLGRMWHRLNKNRSRENGRRYRAARPEVRRAHVAKRKARLLLALTDNPVTGDTILALYAAAEGRCFYCGVNVGDRYDVDHYVPLSRGGKHDPSNLRIACVACNRSKHAKMPEDFIAILPELLRERSSRAQS